MNFETNMNFDEKYKEYYKALLQKDAEYEGVFFVGVNTTGIFCRPSCPARKPKFEHCEFFENAQQALLAGFRPCKRCQPLSHPGKMSEIIDTLVKAIEAEPEKRWKEKDFDVLNIHAATARRHFKKRFNMTFVEYARARRMGIALKKIRQGGKVIDTQLDLGYQSNSGFRDAFAKIMGIPPVNASKAPLQLKAAWLDTRLGPMVAISDESALYLLEFVDRRGLEKEIERLRIKQNACIIPEITPPIEMIQEEVALYFEGNLKKFKTPLHFIGSEFQKMAWHALIQIPYGQTRNYGEHAQLIGYETAFRAVANANGANQLAIVVPCHRIIQKNGMLGGYGGGLVRKEWLIEHEKQNR